MSEIETTKQVGRRTVLKGAAWSVPVVAAAAAMPLAAASTTPQCPTCLKAGVLAAIGSISTNAWAAVSVVASNVGAIQLTAATQIDSTGCDLTLFKPAYVILGYTATLVTHNTNTNTDTSYSSGFISLSGGVGTFGVISALASTFTFAGVAMPNGGALVGNTYPIQLKKLTIVPTLEIDVLLPTQVKLTCQPALVYDLTTLTTIGIVATVPVVGPVGAGTVNWAGTALPA